MVCPCSSCACSFEVFLRLATLFSGDKSTKVHAVASDGEFWTQKTLKAIDRLEKDSKHVSLLEENTQEDAAAARGICSQLHEVRRIKISQ